MVVSVKDGQDERVVVGHGSGDLVDVHVGVGVGVDVDGVGIGESLHGRRRHARGHSGRDESGISQHLAKLRLAALINRGRDGRLVLYRVVDTHLVTLAGQSVEHVLEQRAV